MPTKFTGVGKVLSWYALFLPIAGIIFAIITIVALANLDLTNWEKIEPSAVEVESQPQAEVIGLPSDPVVYHPPSIYIFMAGIPVVLLPLGLIAGMLTFWFPSGRLRSSMIRSSIGIFICLVFYAGSFFISAQ